MASEQPVSPIKANEESATTREELDFEDPQSPQASGRVSPIPKDNPPPPISKSPSPRPRVSFQEHTDDIPTSQPPRRVNSPMVQAEHTLIEAFPTIDAKVVKAVLVASGGQVEPAFNALLGMSDPNFSPEDTRPPQQPPRPARKPINQMEADEMYARQLAEEYDAQSGHRYNQREPARRGPNSQRQGYGEDDRERSFLDDDLPEIGRNIQQGFLETQKKVNSWITNFKKRLDGDDEEEDLYSGSSNNTQRQNFGSSQSAQLRGIQRSEGRRSVEQQRYDADPHVLGDEEFSRLELRDEEEAPQLPRRPQGPIDEVEHAELKAGDGKAKKWQPLTSVAPHPEDDNDPFSVGDDDEKEDKSEDVRKEDTERLKDAARKSVSDGPAELKENETTGVKNADAEKILNK